MLGDERVDDLVQRLAFLEAKELALDKAIGWQSARIVAQAIASM